MRLAPWLGWALLGGCVGVIDDPTGGGDPRETTSETPAESAVVRCDEEAPGVADVPLRRLSRTEYVRTIEDLLGADAVAELSAELRLLPADAIQESVDELEALHAEQHVSAHVEVAARAGELMASDPALRARFTGECTDTSECAARFVASFGTRVMRRPPTPEETASFLAPVADLPGPEAFELLTMRLLLSPDFLFHIERGEEAAGGGRLVRATDYEVASRIAFAVTGAGPDESLLAAAAAGELRDLDAVRAHAERLLESARGREQIDALFTHWLRLDDDVPPPGFFTGTGIDSDGLGEELRRETLDFIRHVVWERSGGMDELFTSSAVFPSSERTAAIYGLASFDPTGAPSDAPRHPGLLTRAGILAGAGLRTTPIVRGAFIRKRLLCASIGLPDAAAVAEAEDELHEAVDPATVSSREYFTRLTSGDTCATCHEQINPLGFAFEGYDPIGRLRREEVVWDERGEEIARHPVDTHVADVRIGPADPPMAFDGAASLIEALADSRELRECAAVHLFRFVRFRREQPEDGCVIRDAAQMLIEGGSIVDAVVATVATEEIFQMQSPGAE